MLRQRTHLARPKALDLLDKFLLVSMLLKQLIHSAFHSEPEDILWFLMLWQRQHDAAQLLEQANNCFTLEVADGLLELSLLVMPGALQDWHVMSPSCPAEHRK